MVNTMGWNERSDPDMRTANFCDVYREGVYEKTMKKSWVDVAEDETWLKDSSESQQDSSVVQVSDSITIK